jgi:HSP20 family molecular chaperone IbpA
MVPSPFHGIFSSFTGDDESNAALIKSRLREPNSRQSEIPTPPKKAYTGVGQVALDIYEFDGYYILKAPLAGVRMADLDIEINENIITLRGFRRQTDTVPDNQYYVQECFWGEFERSVTLPFTIDPKKVKATFNKESILKVLIPKEEKVKIVRVGE